MTNFCITTLQYDVNKELTKINEWMRLNKLSLNYNKSNDMLIKITISEDLVNS